MVFPIRTDGLAQLDGLDDPDAFHVQLEAAANAFAAAVHGAGWSDAGDGEGQATQREMEWRPGATQAMVQLTRCSSRRWFSPASRGHLDGHDRAGELL
jgi:hypothetical protein